MMHGQTVNAPTNISANRPAAFQRFVNPALIAGGASWLIYYSTWIVSGLTTGNNPVIGTPYGTFTSILFFAALIGIHSGLIGLGLYLRARSAGFGTAGLGFAIFGLAASVFGIVATAVFGVKPGLPGGLGVVASCLGATLLAIAALRSGALSRRNSIVLLAIGVVTFPLIVLITAILPTLPSWIVDEMPFAMAGASWIVFSLLTKKHA